MHRVTKMVKINDDVTFLDINNDINNWKNIVFKYYNNNVINREKKNTKLLNYDIDHESKRLEKLFFEMSK